jgi:putative PIN family toxin of toxin-antitoxin system
LKVVFDSNIFVSALLLPGGRAELALEKIVSGEDRLVISKAIIDETLSVLANKFSREREELARAAVFLAELGEIVVPRRRLSVLADEPDNRILECAAAGKVDLIVTGDRAMLGLGEYKGIRIVTLREYLTMPSRPS